MTMWMGASIGLLPPVAAALVAALHGPVGQRLVAVQLATALASLLLALMTFAFDQPSFLDLSLTLAFLSLPGTLLMALFLERWL